MAEANPTALTAQQRVERHRANLSQSERAGENASDAAQHRRKRRSSAEHSDDGSQRRRSDISEGQESQEPQERANAGQQRAKRQAEETMEAKNAKRLRHNEAQCRYRDARNVAARLPTLSPMVRSSCSVVHVVCYRNRAPLPWSYMYMLPSWLDACENC